MRRRGNIIRATSGSSSDRQNRQLIQRSKELTRFIKEPGEDAMVWEPVQAATPLERSREIHATKGRAADR